MIRAGKFVLKARAEVEGKHERAKYINLRHLMDRFTDDYAELLDGRFAASDDE